jgi:hypothetical protein
MVDRERIHHVQNKFAQMIAEAMLAIHPHISEFNEEVKAEYKAKFLDGLEEHSATLLNPLLTSVDGVTTIPPEFASLLQELGYPTEQFTGIISQFFVFGVMFTLAQAMLAPFVQQVQNDVWTAHPDRPLSPPDAATAVVRGYSLGDSGGTDVPADWAAVAAMSGMNADAFASMVGITGMAPNLQLLFEMVRRQIIDEGALNDGGTTLIGGIQQSDIKDAWIPFVSKLRYVQPTPDVLVQAAVRNQTDELPDGVDLSYWKNWATILGLEPVDYLAGNPDWFNMEYNLSGRPPGPQELGRAAMRGWIPWAGTGSPALTFQQGIAESDIKDKWYPLLEQLAQYWPAVGEIGSLLREGGLTVAQAETYWKAAGVPDELGTALLYVSQIQQVTQDRALAKGDILQLVQENAISDDDALTMLAEVGYSGDNAAFLLEGAHFRFELEAIRTSVRNVSTMYVNRSITATQAQEALQGIGMPAAQITALLDTLTNQRNAEVKIPTVAQMASALYYGIVDYATAEAFLVEQGYSTDNAWLVLSVRMHGPIDPAPAGVVVPTPPPSTTAPTTTAS